MKIWYLLIMCFFLFSCAGIDSYRNSSKTVSMGSNIYIEGGAGVSTFINDPLSINEENKNHYKKK